MLYSSLLAFGWQFYSGLGAIFLALILFTTRYRRCPSNRIMVIYGRGTSGRTVECVHGGARFVCSV